MLTTKLREKLHEIFDNEYPRLILWTPAIVALAAYFSIDNFSTITFFDVAFAALFFAASLLFYFVNRNSYKSLIYAALAIFSAAFLFTFFYQKIFNNYQHITGNIFVDVKGRVADFSKFTNKINGHEGLNLLVSDLEFYKIENYKKNKKPKRAKKLTEERVLNDFMNVAPYQDIDRNFLQEKANYQNVRWIEKNGQSTYAMPPHKIRVMAHYVPKENLKIGDVVFFRALISPPKKRQFVGDFDYAFDSLAKGVGGNGFVSGELSVFVPSEYGNAPRGAPHFVEILNPFLEKIYASQISPFAFFDDFFANLRKKIEKIILTDLPQDCGNIAAALLMGNQNLISKEAMNDIRNSGLAHLISISGLHLSLAAGIFFVSSRFLLARSQYLATHFDIKKIAAILAIISSYFYLKISGEPVPAQRSFLAVLLVMLAILFDRKIDPMRSICFAALVLILANPYNIFSISFQLSFAAMLALIALHEVFVAMQLKPIAPTNAQKFSWFVFEMIVVSCFVQFATTPFLIYYFGDVAIYGALSNMIAIPLSSFTTMPLGFLSFFLMPFGLEKIALVPMGITIDWILLIAKFVSNLSYSHFYLPQMPKGILALAIFGGLIFCFCEIALKPLGLLIFTLSFFYIPFVKQPNLLIDAEAKFFAIYDKKEGLVFSKNLRESNKRNLWMKKMNENNFKYFAQFSQNWRGEMQIECTEEICKLSYKNKNILIVLKRAEISKICGNNFNVIVNLTAKYALPDCIERNNNVVIDNLDLLKKGVHFIYLDGDNVKIKSAN